MTANKDAWKLWLLVNTQWRTGNGGLVGLDYTAVILLADRYGIELTPAMIDKLKALEIQQLTYEREEGER